MAKAKRADPSVKKISAGSCKISVDERKRLYVEAFITNGGNARQAAITAGYSEAGSDKASWRFQKDPEVMEMLRKRREKLIAKFELTTERTLLEIARLSYSDPRKLYNEDGTLKSIHELDDDTAAAVAIIEVDEITSQGAVVGLARKTKLWNKAQALEMAAKVLGMYEKDNSQKQPVLLNLNLAGRAN
jgi:phage terminase small subunit